LLFLIVLGQQNSTLLPYTTLFRSVVGITKVEMHIEADGQIVAPSADLDLLVGDAPWFPTVCGLVLELHSGSFRRTSEAVVRGLVDRKSTRLNSSHVKKSYAVFCMK